MRDMNKVQIGEREYPIKCDIEVLECLQDDFGSLDTFEKSLQGIKEATNEDGSVKCDKDGNPMYIQGEPSLKVIRKTLAYMLHEGLEISGESVSADEVLSIIKFCDNPFEISTILYKEYVDSLQVKNVETPSVKGENENQ